MEFRGRRPASTKSEVRLAVTKSPNNSYDVELQMEFKDVIDGDQPSSGSWELAVTSHEITASMIWNSRGRHSASAVSGELELAVTKSPNNSDDVELQMEFKRCVDQHSAVSQEVGVLCNKVAENSSDDVEFADGIQRRSSTSVSRLRELGVSCNKVAK
ncbi:hypothetical protein AVEN_80296-1 [Araneus ventricosus]|uniref:Uncharacterized protein n=1 Tax=Araneus ventricosus TaxID=182803 RepID=A0A4Y2IKD5_ARAVE|nr:hypothetical protein AVEN_80296-1 [Araneus ventricosus]